MQECAQQFAQFELVLSCWHIQHVFSTQYDVCAFVAFAQQTSHAAFPGSLLQTEPTILSCQQTAALGGEGRGELEDA